jgi:hypothetical protein
MKGLCELCAKKVYSEKMPCVLRPVEHDLETGNLKFDRVLRPDELKQISAWRIGAPEQPSPKK